MAKSAPNIIGIDPLALAGILWPKNNPNDPLNPKGLQFYDKQIEIIRSVWQDAKTYVPAGNKLGKDFIAGFIALAFFLTHRPVKIITTSVKDEHLDVLWGEIDRFIRTCRYPMLAKDGGPLVYLHQEIRRVVNGVEEMDSYLKGQVSKKGEGMAGHHAAHTLIIMDEASGVDEVVYEMAQGWAAHMLIIGNPNPCINFFKRGVFAGDLVDANS